MKTDREFGKSQRPGEMTAAMRAALMPSATREPKLLRVGVVQAGRVREERTLFHASDVCVGRNEENSFILADAAAPGSFRLFEANGDSYQLNFSEQMRGRVADARGTFELDALKTRAHDSGAATYRIPLAEDARGRIVIGATTILFHFVERPPPRPRAVLPAAVLRGPVRVDWNSTLAAAFSFLVHFMVLGVAYSDWSDPVIDDDLRTAGLIDSLRNLPPPPPVEEQPRAEEPSVVPRDAPEKRDPQRRDVPRVNNAASPPMTGSRGPDTAALVRELAQIDTSILGVLANAQPATGTVLRRSEVAWQSLDAAAASRAGVGRGSDFDLPASGVRIHPTQTTSLRDVGTKSRDEGGPGRVATVKGPRGSANIAAATTAGGAVGNAARVVAGMRAAFRACYERGLAQDPDAGGGIRLTIHVASGGEVASVSAVPSGTLPCDGRRLRASSRAGGPIRRSRGRISRDHGASQLRQAMRPTAPWPRRAPLQKDSKEDEIPDPFSTCRRIVAPGDKGTRGESFLAWSASLHFSSATRKFRAGASLRAQLATRLARMRAVSRRSTRTLSKWLLPLRDSKVHGSPRAAMSVQRLYGMATAMRNLHFKTALVSGLILGLVVSACGAESGETRRPGADGGAGSTDKPKGGAPSTSSGGSTVIVVEPPPDKTAPPNCGDGNLTSDEACDDGNTKSGDGCTSNCLQVERGFSCASPGKPCREIARCGDGIVAASEQCDDGNVMPGDGCSDRCRVELGKKCEGTPSVCTDAQCGNGKVEGAESCDDGNTVPFDGCSALCLREPNCSGASCTSECGDGLLINEECDDGNTIDGDGCSSKCTKETGFTCKQEAQCEKVNGQCVLRVPTIFRDFSDKDADFGWPVYPDTTCGIKEGDPIVPGIAQDKLDKDGRPVFGKAPKEACIESAQTFARWFRDNTGTVKVVGNIVLFDNGRGGYVNRFGQNGEKLVTTVAPPKGQPQEQQVPNATSKATCQPGCTQRVRSSLQCDNTCRPQTDKVRSSNDVLRQRQDELTQRQTQLETRQMDATPDAAAIATLEAQIADLEETIADLEATIATQTAAAEKCTTDCQTNFDAQVAACVADCKPCSSSPTQYCTGGTVAEFDGTPLFFPVDSVMGATRDADFAQLPLQYGFTGWPSEDKVFPGAKQHNFYFTSEVQYWFRYETNTNARLDFTGDDDVFVFVNGHLAVDLGGIHVPMDGTVTINAQSAARFELKPGNVYKIAVFQAERKKFGSSFRLTLSGFEATPSDCRAVCGDGILSFGEECDDGVNDGGYGECDAGCKLGPFCGDGIVQPPEHCDNGPNGADCPGCRKLEPPR